ncbi:helix-turn-helix domain-containing protein [Anthocerotibacter panamensis]|uniref:helix-turn-helix domain-containing protein n=1 Tax=Anthocerotibacter panamensis TaxID=2857077 RepID=UPI001C402863|nr:helix-turn-helix transcriptional regulator [Anthocerotibacter panamensis]
MDLDKANISGPKIRKERLRRQWDQVELAAALTDYGITLERSDISEIELQKRGVKDYELDAFAKVFDIDPIFLLRGEETND